MVLTIGALRAFAATHALRWQIEFQGINVADKASGAGGDITVQADGRVVMAFEITERPLDEARIRTAYTTKIAKLAIADYAFLHETAEPSAVAQAAARKLFAQGHDVLLLPCEEFLMSLLVLAGRAGRGGFVAEVRGLLASASMPTAMRVAWNKSIGDLAAG